MRKLVLALVTFIFIENAIARGVVSVHGYTRSNGTYVAPHIRSAPDSYRFNNFGSETNGGHQRDEFSNPPAYNQSYHGMPQSQSQYQRQPISIPNTDWSKITPSTTPEKTTIAPNLVYQNQQPVIPVYPPVKEQNTIQNAIVVAPTNVQVAEYKPEPKKKVKKYNLDPNLDLRYCLEIKNIVEFDKCVNQ